MARHHARLASLLLVLALLGAPQARGAGARARPLAPARLPAVPGIPAFTRLSPARAQSLRSILLGDPASSDFSPEAVARLYSHIPDAARKYPVLPLLYSPQGLKELTRRPSPAPNGVAEALRRRNLTLGNHIAPLVYESLARVLESPLPAAKRLELAAGLSRRFASFFDGVARSPEFSEPVRREALGYKRRLLDPRQVLWGLARQSEVRRRLNLLETDMKRARETIEDLAPSLGVSPDSLLSPEQRPIPKPDPDKTRQPEESDREDAPYERHARPRDIGNKASSARVYLAQAISLLKTALQRPFSRKSRFRALQRAFRALTWAEERLPLWQSDMSRFRDDIHDSFMAAQDEPPELWLPSHPGLSLLPAPGGALLLARFETDIPDPVAWRALKDSIESYWRGTFDIAGEPFTLTTRVFVRPLKQGEAFSGKALRFIHDPEKATSHAFPDVIVVGGDGALRYPAFPAHEFGHILGLKDEYSRVYDPKTGDVIDTQHPSSLMGSSEGRIWPRHLKQALRLLLEAGK